ncbi:hypothetical protein FB45DRAFT_1085351 [Roridomyces roridus]|uniref:Clathrin heavy chain linker core motif domain-containing protein n=1 Tax=Roridomyces roridus TaxID=1738132 RepID=A0AAD7AY25_9AGAR|nr:hypothetical protein FB45DRAFT_1085351 [Roridomyces roridus]
MSRISGETIFVTVDIKTLVDIGVNKKGQVLSVNVDEQTIIPYILAVLNDTELAFKLASRANLLVGSNFYHPEKVKNFLKEAKLSDGLLLIIIFSTTALISPMGLLVPEWGHQLHLHSSNSQVDVGCDEGAIKSLLSELDAAFKYNMDSSNNNPEAFLKDNDPHGGRKFCDKRDPCFAYVVYAKGFCEDEPIAITNENSIFKQQARYLVSRRQPDLRAQLVVGAISAVTSCSITLWGRLSPGLINESAKIATEHGLYEEALPIYKTCEQHALEINVLAEHIVSIDRGLEFANKVNKPEPWSRLAKAQLDGLRIKDGIGRGSFQVPSKSLPTLREPKIDTQLAHAYAKTGRLHDMEDFLGMTNVADVLEVQQ